MSENKNTSCIFCKIARGEIPSYKVYEDNEILAFLDINPASRGHTLVVVKEHVDDVTKCPRHLLDRAFEVAQMIAQAMVSQLGADGVNILTNAGEVAGQSVPHFHIHVIPRYINDGLKLTFPPKQLENKEMEDLKDILNKAL
ncbi:MAG: HIT family protein [Bacilli bacterium]|nr:HIT family protein [Bacilli bacterium]